MLSSRVVLHCTACHEHRPKLNNLQHRSDHEHRRLSAQASVAKPFGWSCVFAERVRGLLSAFNTRCTATIRTVSTRTLLTLPSYFGCTVAPQPLACCESYSQRCPATCWIQQIAPRSFTMIFALYICDVSQIAHLVRKQLELAKAQGLPVVLTLAC